MLTTAIHLSAVVVNQHRERWHIGVEQVMRNCEGGGRCWRLDTMVELRKKWNKHFTHGSLPVLEYQTNKETVVIWLSLQCFLRRDKGVFKQCSQSN